MRVIVVLCLVGVFLQKATSASSLNDARSGKSSISTEYEARFNQIRQGSGPNQGSIAGTQCIESEANEESWEGFAAKCAEVIKNLVSALASAISCQPGDSTDLQLDIKNRIFHHDDRKFNACKPAAFLPAAGYCPDCDDETTVGTVVEVPNSPSLSFPNEASDSGPESLDGGNSEKGYSDGEGYFPGAGYGANQGYPPADEQEYIPPLISGAGDDSGPFASTEGYSPSSDFGTTQSYVPAAVGQSPIADSGPNFDEEEYVPVGNGGGNDGYRPDAGYAPGEGYDVPEDQGYAPASGFRESNGEYLSDNSYGPQGQYRPGNDYNPSISREPENGYSSHGGYRPIQSYGPSDGSYSSNGSSYGYDPDYDGYAPSNSYGAEGNQGNQCDSDCESESSSAVAPVPPTEGSEASNSEGSSDTECPAVESPTEGYPPSEPTMNTPATQAGSESSYPVTPVDRYPEQTEDSSSINSNYGAASSDSQKSLGTSDSDTSYDEISQPLSTDALPIDNWKPSNGQQESELLPQDATIADDGPVTSPNLAPAAPDTIAVPIGSSAAAPVDDAKHTPNAYEFNEQGPEYDFMPEPQVSEPFLPDEFGPGETMPLPQTDSESPTVNFPSEEVTSQPSECIEPSETVSYPSYVPKATYGTYPLPAVPLNSANQVYESKPKDASVSNAPSFPVSPFNSRYTPSVVYSPKQLGPGIKDYGSRTHQNEIQSNANEGASDVAMPTMNAASGYPDPSYGNSAAMFSGLQSGDQKFYPQQPPRLPNAQFPHTTPGSTDNYFPVDSYVPSERIYTTPSPPIYIPIGNLRPVTDTSAKQPVYDSEPEDSCSCDDCYYEDIIDHKAFCQTACKDLEEARDELKAIFDKIKKKLKCTKRVRRQGSS